MKTAHIVTDFGDKPDTTVWGLFERMKDGGLKVLAMGNRAGKAEAIRTAEKKAEGLGYSVYWAKPKAEPSKRPMTMSDAELRDEIGH